MAIGRGEIWWADLPEPMGSAPGYRRPVLVVQNDAFNRSRLATVTIVALTGNVRLVAAPGNVLIPAAASGLPRDSVANASQIATVNKGDLDALAGTVPQRLLDKVNDGLRWFLTLDA